MGYSDLFNMLGTSGIGSPERSSTDVDAWQANKDMAENSGVWQDRAACKGVDPALFFPIGEKNEMAEKDIIAAKGICDYCVVRYECLVYALEMGAQHGVWGGMSESERIQLKRNQ